MACNRGTSSTGLRIADIPTGPPPLISGAPTSIALFVGWAPSGPAEALPLSSFRDFEQKFGGPDARSLLGYAVRHFYDNGGANAFVLRIVGAMAARSRQPSCRLCG